ncbi:IS3 family transposase [Ottowia sp.]|uniref:IS3 family transposase n=1 Tax=Ottowia sp. TaxID=1898956 RepID=UPI003A87693B
MKYAWIHAQMIKPTAQRKHSAAAYCKALQVSRSGFHQWRARQAQQAAGAGDAHDAQEQTAQLDSAARHIHAASRATYGAVRMRAALERRGHTLSLSGVKRLCRRLGLRCQLKRRFVRTTDSAHDLPIAPNLLEQRFDAIHQPGRVWLADITYIATDEGWVYLAAVKDACSRKIVGWSVRQHMRAELVIEAMQMAIEQERPLPGLIAHSDRGSQYASAAYRKLLSGHQMQASMSRAGNCYDNAPMESFFSSLKNEHLHRLHFETAQQAMDAVFDYIATFYNPHRLHTSLGNVSPHEFLRQYHSRQPSLSDVSAPAAQRDMAGGQAGEGLPPHPLLPSRSSHEIQGGTSQLHHVN